MIMKDSERTEYFDKIAIEISKKYKGKIQTISKVPITGLQDFSSLYTPGIAAVSKKIQAEKELVYDLTGKWKEYKGHNSIANKRTGATDIQGGNKIRETI